MSVCLCVHVMWHCGVHACVCVHVCMRACVHAHAHVHVCVCLCECVCICVCLCVCICVCVQAGPTGPSGLSVLSVCVWSACAVTLCDQLGQRDNELDKTTTAKQKSP